MKRPRKRAGAGREQQQQQQAQLPGRVRYRPPQGKPGDRALNRLKMKSMNGNAGRDNNR